MGRRISEAAGAAYVEMQTEEVERLEVEMPAAPKGAERFYRGDKARARPEGLGLGLAITHELVKAHGGNILVSSAPDRGTTFLVELPI